MLSQIIRFALPPPLTISALEFHKLRQNAVAAGAIAQYFGYTIPTRASALPTKKNEVCWTIQWPDAKNRDSSREQLAELAVEGAVSLTLDFLDAQSLDFAKALEAPVCEFACIRLADTAPLSDAALQKSMHKTYTDTYMIEGFTGGYWGYAANTNESRGASLSAEPQPPIPEGERRLGVYYLGWESIEHHERATKTEVFAEELTKLLPHFGPGSGAWYVKFEKH
ncbi:hypothetical protein B0T10DRAFT_560719 [Thelonectria olida]|uniref:Uncharacterized protein n=1 Tax=Thelonectria olida TaxID=1576542 RepID=A0A9P9AR76_9HYPO|nr:hypothetical protein B0T10DRAFT_560719 [Thelonectria olida]